MDENELLQALISVEDLAEKKASIYARLLTEVSLAQRMETLANAHKQRKQALEMLMGEE